MTACPIRYQRQVPDRKGKIFYTSITSLSHISKVSRIHLELQGAQALGDVLFEKLFVKDRPDRMAYEMEYDRLVLLNRMNASQVERGLEWLGSLEETLGKMLKEKEGVA